MMHLLIVDDEPLAIQGIESGVRWELLGISAVCKAGNIRQAKEIFSKHPVDIMLCDIEMPQGNGLELLAWVRETHPATVSIILTCHADFEYARTALQLGSLDYVLKTMPYEELEAVIGRAIRKAEQDRDTRVWLDNVVSRIREGDSGSEDSPSIVEKVKRHYAMHLEENPSREELAALVFLSPDHLSRLFKKETGETLNHYCQNTRMSHIQELLAKTDMNIGKIATHMGYVNFSHFARAFKESTGMSPTEYRERSHLTCR